MNKFLFWVAILASFPLAALAETAAGASAATANNEANNDEPPRFECSYVNDWSGYGYTIRVYNDIATIIHTSPWSQFNPISYQLQAQTFFGKDGFDGPVQYTCSGEKDAKTGYQFQIEVYQNEVFVLESSKYARQTGLSYKIIRE